MAWTTVGIRGGLGNQLFQYAAGRAVAERTGTRLRLDACFCAADPLREFELDRFRIRAKVVHGPAESAEYIGHDSIEDAWVRGRYGAETVREPHYHYSDVLEHAGPDTFISGYWHSEKHFSGHERTVRAELTPRRLARPARTIKRQIERTGKSVAVHVRRGDKAADPALLDLFGVCPSEYYSRAAALICEHRANPHFFVFSDDPQWCADNLELPGKMEVVSGSTSGPEDLALISSCADAIIANSTFSWWGAWLGETSDSIVVAPRKWYDQHPNDTNDLLPDRWQLV